MAYSKESERVRLCYEDYTMITTKEHLDPGLETETERYKIHTIGLEVFKFVGSFKIRITSPA